MLGVGDARGIRTARLTLGGQTLALKPGTFHPSTAGACTPRCPNPCSPPLTALPQRWTWNWWAPSACPSCPGQQHRGAVEQRLAAPFVYRALSALRSGRCGTTASRRNGVCRPWPPPRSKTQEGKPVCQASTSGDDQATAPRPAAAVPTASAWPSSTREPVFAGRPRHQIRRTVYCPHLRGRGSLRADAAPARARAPVQYLLVGSALCSFFLLLLSLSEHLPFGASYALAVAPACCCWLTTPATCWQRAPGPAVWRRCAALWLCCTCCCNWSRQRWWWARLALFAVLALVMVLTRQVNWYGPPHGVLPQRRNRQRAAPLL